MTRVSQLPAYDSPYLKSTDLQNRSARVTIERVAIEPLRQATGTRENKIVITFVGKSKQLVANRTQARMLVELYGDDTDNWVGKTIMLAPGKADNGKETIVVMAAPPAAAATPGG